MVAISAFVVIGLFTTTGSGRSVRTESGKVLEALIQYSLGRSAQYVAEVIEKKFDHIGGEFHNHGGIFLQFVNLLVNPG